MRSIQKKNFLTSLLLHLLIFASIGCYFNFLSTANVRQGEHDAKIITSYLYQDHQLINVRGLKKQTIIDKEPQKQEQKPSPANKQTIVKNNLPIKKSADQRVSVTKQVTASSAAQMQSSSAGEQVKGLLALLHTAIQNKQQYPPSAMQMGRQGRVTVGFTLSPNGSISNVQLIKSCGTSSLDEAGLAAVRSAAPFIGVDSYLKTTQDFTIDVVFALDAGSE